MGLQSARIRAVGSCAPRLPGVHDEEPLALLIAELGGRRMEDESISEANLHQAWHDAGRAGASLHGLAICERFGPCSRRVEELACLSNNKHVGSSSVPNSW